METQKPLWTYIVAVAIVWVIILTITWFLGDKIRFQKFIYFFLAFALGMLAMYIAIHIYKY